MPLTTRRARRRAATCRAGSRTRAAARTLSRAAARTLSLAVACAFAALAALLAVAGPAAAHAELVSSSPSDRAVVDAEPPQVALVFSEAVTPRLSTVTVIGPDGRRVDNGPLHTVGSGSARVAVPLAPDARRGTYVLTWRVTTADDGHTTSGALTFSVGAPSLPPSASAGGAPSRSGGSNRVTDTVLDIAVWLGFAGLALLVGFAVVNLYCLPRQPAIAESCTDAGTDAYTDDGDQKSADDARDEGSADADEADVGEDADDADDACARDAVAPHPLGALRWPGALGWGVLLIGTVLHLLVYGPATQGGSVAHMLDRSLLSASLSTHVGHTLVARIMLLAVVAIAGEAILRHRAAGTVAATALTLLLALTWSEISHAPSGPHAGFAVLVTTLHVTSMAVWAGGLATLAVLLARGTDAGAVVGAAAARFSGVALTAVCVLAATGLYQAYREVGGFSALTGTHYGRLLLTKAGEFVLVLAIATVTRTRAHRGRRQAAYGTLRRSVMLELAGVTGVLIVTVMLIGTAPAHTADTGAHTAATTITPATVTAPATAPAARPAPLPSPLATAAPSALPAVPPAPTR